MRQFVHLSNNGFQSWLEATHVDDVVHMDETLRIIDNPCEDISPFPVHVSWNCLESTLSSSDVEVATSRHSGCRTCI